MFVFYCCLVIVLLCNIKCPFLVLHSCRRRKRACCFTVIVFLSCDCWCFLCLFPTELPCVGLQGVILAFSSHIHFHFRHEILDKLKARDLNATSLSTYDFPTLYTTLPHNLIKDKLIDLIERTFQREGYPYLACNDRNAFLLQKNLKNIMHGLVKMYVMR